MSRVRHSVLVPGPPADAEEHWYDTTRWPAFVDGFGHVAKQDPVWPARGAKLAWDSTPHGRGRVLEIVTEHMPGAGQTLEVEDEKLRGTQRVSFAAEGEGTRVGVELRYELKERNPLTPVIDLLFVRRAVGDSVRRTLERFAHERAGDIELIDAL